MERKQLGRGGQYCRELGRGGAVLGGGQRSTARSLAWLETKAPKSGSEATASERLGADPTNAATSRASTMQHANRPKTWAWICQIEPNNDPGGGICGLGFGPRKRRRMEEKQWAGDAPLSCACGMSDTLFLFAA